jgi:hypothetical protein
MWVMESGPLFLHSTKLRPHRISTEFFREAIGESKGCPKGWQTDGKLNILPDPRSWASEITLLRPIQSSA